MPDYTDNYIIATIHDFKTHISKYIKMLEKEHYRAVIVKRRYETVGIFIPYEPRKREEEHGIEPYS